ncbi:MAG TPA: hypothetical protein ENL12_04350 [Dehalococcoidia bacterium]|nr:hypothetical protein [Dehalococcoidia bacterium]
MNRKRIRVLAGVLVAVIVLTGVLIGTVSADNSYPAPGRDRLLARVAEILGVDQADVENAFQQALQEQREARQQTMQQAREARIQQLIDERIITQEQADEWKEWLESRPDYSDEMREWFESRPDFDCRALEGTPRFDGRVRRAGGLHRWSSGMPGWCDACPAWD